MKKYFTLALLVLFSGLSVFRALDESSENVGKTITSVKTQNEVRDKSINLISATSNPVPVWEYLSHHERKKSVEKLAPKERLNPIAHAQIALNREGAGLVVDGWRGPSTRAAIKAFQTSQNLKPTGRLNITTLKKLKLL